MNISVKIFEFKLTFFRIADDIKCMSLLILSLLNSVQLRGQPFTSGLELVGDGHEGIDQAIAFCKDKNDEELWADLIKFSIDKPCK